MTTVREIYEYINSFAPFETAEGFDNVGLLVGSPSAEVENCLVALDVTAQVIDEAVKKGCTLIVSHHPVIFQPLKNLLVGSFPARLLQQGIHVISAHTNLDKAAGGVNDALAAALALKDIQPFEGSDDMGRIGTLETPMPPEAFASHVKTALGAAGVRYVAGNRPVSKVAVLGGGGDFALHPALAAGADALVTGEAKHHIFLDAHHCGATYVDAGHFDTEQVVCPVLAWQLFNQFPGLQISVSECKNPVQFL